MSEENNEKSQPLIKKPLKLISDVVTPTNFESSKKLSKSKSSISSRKLRLFLNGNKTTDASTSIGTSVQFTNLCDSKSSSIITPYSNPFSSTGSRYNTPNAQNLFSQKLNLLNLNKSNKTSSKMAFMVKTGSVDRNRQTMNQIENNNTNRNIKNNQANDNIYENKNNELDPQDFIYSIKSSIPPLRLKYLYINFVHNQKSDSELKFLSPLHSPKVGNSKEDLENPHYLFSMTNTNLTTGISQRSSQSNKKEAKLGMNKMFFNFTKKFFMAKQVISGLTESVNKVNPKESENNTQPNVREAPLKVITNKIINHDIRLRKRIEETRLTLQEILSLIEKALQNKRSRRIIEDSLKNIVTWAHHANNIELYLIVLNTQAKIYYHLNDLPKAIFYFKNVKRIAEEGMKFTKLLKIYKYIVRCYQEIGNYYQAKFYCVKLLQCAWVCKSKRYELQAYDYLGMQYYYLGETEKAQYYHNKMTFGECEPENSDLRRLGTHRIMEHVKDLIGKEKRLSKIRSQQEEHDMLEYSMSENDFDLPFPHHKLKEQIEQHEKDLGNFEKKKKTIADALAERKFRSALFKMSNNNDDRLTKQQFSYINQDHVRHQSSIIGGEESKHSFNANKISDKVLVSHLSLNRSALTKYATYGLPSGAIIANDSNGETNLTLKAIEKVKKKLEKLKDNILVIQNNLINIVQKEFIKFPKNIIPNSTNLEPPTNSNIKSL